MTHRCWAEIDLDALQSNLSWLRHRVGPKVRIMTVVKADAYGHGLRQIASQLMQSGTDIFGVANLEEARAIRSVGRGWPILMLGACLPDEMERAVRDEIMPTISSLAEARQFSELGRKLNKTVVAHLKIDTGMGRLGLDPADAPSVVKAAAQLPNLRISGIYTHFASAEDDSRFTRKQLQKFERLTAQLAASGFQFDHIHASNSAAILHEPKSIFTLVRPGLLVYGLLPPGHRRANALLRKHIRPALTWKCRVTLVKPIPAGTPLSYGRSFIAPRAMQVATLSAGYGDGYLRSGSGHAQVLIHGRHCPVLGRITMDQMLVDVSSVPKVKSGDEVVLIGRQGRNIITANQLAQWSQTVPWEILTAINHRVARHYLNTHAS
ncbi:MAG: alanine racemase [Pedosphaera sp.]|nr:alanine racemase [Pedosphaera sp.]